VFPGRKQRDISEGEVIPYTITVKLSSDVFHGKQCVTAKWYLSVTNICVSLKKEIKDAHFVT